MRGDSAGSVAPAAPGDPTVFRKLALAAVVFMVAVTGVAVAQDQKIEITPFVGYRFNGTFDNVDQRQNPTVSSVNLTDGLAYGFLFDVNLGENAQVEFSWSRQDSTLQAKFFNGDRETAGDLASNYIHVGGNYLFGDSYDDLRWFIGGSLGATYFDPSESGVSSETQFSFGFQGGFKFFFSDFVGVRVQGRIVSTYINSSDGYWCYFYCFYTTYSNYLTDIEVDGGLVLRF